MACFLVPAATAVVTTLAGAKVAQSEQAAETAGKSSHPTDRIPWSTRISWLNNMLWGGVVLLLLEHIWHGEVVFYPPFLTAMADPADTATMLHEMATVGVGMTVLVTLVWLVICLAVEYLPGVRRALTTTEGAHA